MFQNTLTPLGTELVAGAFFLGINKDIVMRFPGLDIPPGAVITAASIDLVASRTNAGAMSLDILALDHSNSTATGVWKPEAGHTGWRREKFGNQKIHVRDTGAGTIANPVTGAGNTNWFLRLFATHRERIAQAFTPSVTATLGDALMNLQRVGSPVGNITLEIHGSTAGLSGITEPDETVLATSDVVDASTVPSGSPADVTFTFSGGDQISLTGGVEYFAVFTGTYTMDFANAIAWRVNQAFLSTGGGRHYGTGFAFDQQLYMGNSDLWETSRANIGPTVTWSVPAATTGVTYTTPDLAGVIQAIVDSADYAPNDPMGISMQSTSAPSGTNRGYAADDHATLAAPVLSVTYEVSVLSLTGSRVTTVTRTGSTLNQVDLTGSSEASLGEGRQRQQYRDHWEPSAGRHRVEQEATHDAQQPDPEQRLLGCRGRQDLRVHDRRRGGDSGRRGHHDLRDPVQPQGRRGRRRGPDHQDRGKRDHDHGRTQRRPSRSRWTTWTPRAWPRGPTSTASSAPTRGSETTLAFGTAFLHKTAQTA